MAAEVSADANKEKNPEGKRSQLGEGAADQHRTVSLVGCSVGHGSQPRYVSLGAQKPGMKGGSPRLQKTAPDHRGSAELSQLRDAPGLDPPPEGCARNSQEPPVRLVVASCSHTSLRTHDPGPGDPPAGKSCQRAHRRF